MNDKYSTGAQNKPETPATNDDGPPILPMPTESALVNNRNEVAPKAKKEAKPAFANKKDGKYVLLNSFLFRRAPCWIFLF